MTRPDTGEPTPDAPSEPPPGTPSEPPPDADLAGAKLAGLLDAVGHGVLILDRLRRIADANPAFVALTGLGLPAAQLRGTHLPAGPATFHHLYREPESATRRLTAALDGGRRVGDDRHAMADGRVLAHDYTPITDGGRTVGHLWQLRVVDAADDDGDGAPGDGCRGATATLVATLAATAARRRAEFAAALAHEVRTPATSIAAFAELLDDPGLDAGGRHRAAATVRRSAERMLILAADLVLLSDLEAHAGAAGGGGTGARAGGDLPGDCPVDLGDLVSASAARAVSAGAPVDATVGPGPALPGDRTLLLRAVDAVIGVVTAVCAAPDGGGVAAGVLVRATHDQAAGWTVTATGHTAREVTTEQLITARVVAPDEPDTARTAALCLLLARAVATRHGGDLTTECGQERYTVTLRLPRR